jgi:hypothetical protein
MFRATTPTHIFALPFNTGQIKEIRITYQQNGENVLQKTEADCTMTENEIKVVLSQEETLLFAPRNAETDNRISIQLRVLTNSGQVMASNIEKLFALECLDEEVLA